MSTQFFSEQIQKALDLLDDKIYLLFCFMDTGTKYKTYGNKFYKSNDYIANFSPDYSVELPKAIRTVTCFRSSLHEKAVGNVHHPVMAANMFLLLKADIGGVRLDSI